MDRPNNQGWQVEPVFDRWPLAVPPAMKRVGALAASGWFHKTTRGESAGGTAIAKNWPVAAPAPVPRVVLLFEEADI